ncbi:MAG TPA: Flp family type IVb pilin [Allosphingosinicella sp.]|nr:Flp family type IVb pilin [Allosphingosinicella sp.]
MRKLRHLLRDESGATAIEYGLLLALLAIAMLAALSRLGFTLVGLFETIAAALGG